MSLVDRCGQGPRKRLDPFWVSKSRNTEAPAFGSIGMLVKKGILENEGKNFI